MVVILSQHLVPELLKKVLRQKRIFLLGAVHNC